MKNISPKRLFNKPYKLNHLSLGDMWRLYECTKDVENTNMSMALSIMYSKIPSPLNMEGKLYWFTKGAIGTGLGIFRGFISKVTPHGNA